MHKGVRAMYEKFVHFDEQENSKKLLTFLFKYDIIYVSRGERGLLPMTEKENKK